MPPATHDSADTGTLFAGYVLDGTGGLSATVMLVLAVCIVALYLFARR